MNWRIKHGEGINFCREMIFLEYPDRSEIRIVPAEIEFDLELALNLGGVTARLIHVAGSHSEEAVVCHVPEDHFLYLGDRNGDEPSDTVFFAGEVSAQLHKRRKVQRNHQHL